MNAMEICNYGCLAVGFNDYNQLNVDGWTDIVRISSGTDHTVGLKADGTVVAAGNNTYGQCDVSDWTDIVAISAGLYQTIGLKADGTVVSAGLKEAGVGISVSGGEKNGDGVECEQEREKGV
jgi:alpha-tubulin suppressor-like RCC1 family protein